MQHNAPISDIDAFSDKYIATAGYDNRIILWDSTNNEPIARSWHDHLVNSVKFSNDGTRIISASSDYTARVWSVPELNLLHVFTHHCDDVMKADFSPCNKYIATISYDSRIVINNAKTFEVVAVFTGHAGLIESFCWLPGTTDLLSCGTDGRVLLWSLQLKSLKSELSGFECDIDTIVATHQEKIIIGDDLGRITICDYSLKKLSTHQVHSSGIKSIIINNNTKMLASLGYDGAIHIHSIDKTIKKIYKSCIPKIVWPRSGVFINSEIIAFATFGSTYAILDIEKNIWYEDHIVPSISLNSVFTSVSGPIAIGDEGIIKSRNFKGNHPNSLCNFIIESKGNYICGGQTGEIFFSKNMNALHKHDAPLNDACLFEKDGCEFLAVASYSGEIIVFSFLKNNKHVQSIKVSNTAIKSICFDGCNLVSGCADGTIIITDIRTWICKSPWEKIHSSILNDICVIGNNEYLSVSRDLTIVHYKDDKALSYKSRLKNSIKSVCYAANYNTAIIGSYFGWLDFFHVDKGCFINSPLRISEAGISSLAWDQHFNCIYASSYDGAIYRVTLDRKVEKIDP